MTPDAQKILNMIEEVDPADNARLDEIDARVWCYFHNDEYITHTGNTSITYTPKNIICTASLFDFPRPQYTRSRDALKSARPKGWYQECLYGYEDDKGKPMYSFTMTKYPENWINQDGTFDLSLRSPDLRSSEELAELHAIIQAIDFERTQ